MKALNGIWSVSKWFRSSVLCMHCNELNLHFLKTVDAAHNSKSRKDGGEAFVVLVDLLSLVIAAFTRNMKDYVLNP